MVGSNGRKQSCVIRNDEEEDDDNEDDGWPLTFSPFCGFIRKFRPMSSNIMVFLLL